MFFLKRDTRRVVSNTKPGAKNTSLLVSRFVRTQKKPRDTMLGAARLDSSLEFLVGRASGAPSCGLFETRLGAARLHSSLEFRRIQTS